MFKMGFVTFYSDEVAEFAGKAGFDCMECFIDRGGELDLDKMTPQKLDSIMKHLEKNNVKFGSLSSSINLLATDPDERKANVDYYIKGIRMCKDFGTDVMMTNAGSDRSKTPEQNLEEYKKVYSVIAEEAEKNGIKIALENCPHWGGYPTYLGNIGYSPEMFEYMFEAVPSKSIGLEYDPSHLFWLGIDYIGMLNEFSDRIYAMHAKDTEILEDKLKRYGIIGRQVYSRGEDQNNWWRYRLPGFGQVDFAKIMQVLTEIRYKGNIIIEHEDPVFGGTRSEDGMEVNMMEEGLKIGLKNLKKLM